MRQHFRWYGFLYFLLAAFLLSWTGQLVTQVIAFVNEARDHGQQPTWGDFWPEFFASTFENWQSEFLQLLVQALGMVVLATYIFRRSEADKHRMERKIDRLLAASGVDPDKEA